jgi:general secretion pathway protein A
MYLDAFGLKKKPFSLSADPSMLYFTDFHQEALAAVSYGLLEKKGLMLLLGHAGTGKTTVVARAMLRLPASRVQFVSIVNPTMDAKAFLESVLLGFGILKVPASKAQRLARLEEHLMRTQTEGKIAVLIVDEAHKLSPKALEEVRLLGNLERDSEKLLQILLVGQNEIRAVLNRGDCVQLKQRVALRVSLRALTSAEVGQYIACRWARAGGKQLAPFSPQAVDLIARVSEGVPRLINVICDNALMAAFGDHTSTVQAGHVSQSCLELDLMDATLESLGDVEQPARSIQGEPRRGTWAVNGQ